MGLGCRLLGRLIGGWWVGGLVGCEWGRAGSSARGSGEMLGLSWVVMFRARPMLLRRSHPCIGFFAERR